MPGFRWRCWFSRVLIDPTLLDLPHAFLERTIIDPALSKNATNREEPHLIDKHSITAVILAGGRGSRMGGRDKGLLPLGGRPLITHIIAGIKPQVGTLLINANRNHEMYAKFAYPVVSDSIDGFQGPLAGFLAGFDASATDYLLTLPCDGPNLIPDLAERLAKGLCQQGADIAVAHDGEQLQPVYTLMHRRVLPSLRAALAAGERGVRHWIPRNPWTKVDFSDAPGLFKNFNRPEDLTESAASHAGD